MVFALEASGSLFKPEQASSYSNSLLLADHAIFQTVYYSYDVH